MLTTMASKEELSVTKQGQGSNRLRSKMLSKEAAAQLAVPSFRVYYSVASAGAVPFLWESQPGTPKNDSPSAAALPPLTPPPSYYASGKGGTGAGGRSSKKRRSAGAAIFAFLRRPGRSTTPTTPCASASSSSSWSSTSSSSSSAMSPVFAVARSPAAADGSRGGLRRTFSAGEDDAGAEAPCFGMEPECCERGMVKGCSVVGAVRNALATVIGGKPAGRRA